MLKLTIPILLFGFLGCADATRNDEPQFEIVKVRYGVWAAIATDGGHAGANSGIVDLGDQKILIFDTSLTPAVGTLLKETAESLIDGRVFLVVNSNFESDHVRGNQAFPGASLFGTTRTQAGITESEPGRLEQQRANLPDRIGAIREEAGNAMSEQEKKDYELRLGYLDALESSVDDVIPTTLTLVWDHKMNFTGEARRVKIIPFNHAATESDAVLYLQADSLLFCSDLLVVDRHPSMQTSNLDGWRAALDSLDLLPVREIIPGHGPITDKSGIVRTRQYLDMVVAMADQVEAGNLVIAEAVPAPPFDELLRADIFRENLLTIVNSNQQAD